MKQPFLQESYHQRITFTRFLQKKRKRKREERWKSCWNCRERTLPLDNIGWKSSSDSWPSSYLPKKRWQAGDRSCHKIWTVICLLHELGQWLLRYRKDYIYRITGLINKVRKSALERETEEIICSWYKYWQRNGFTRFLSYKLLGLEKYEFLIFKNNNS